MIIQRRICLAQTIPEVQKQLTVCKSNDFGELTSPMPLHGNYTFMPL